MGPSRGNGWNRDTNRKPIHELYAKGELNLQSERPAEPRPMALFTRNGIIRPHGAFKYYTYDQFYRNFDVAGGAKYALGGQNFLSVDLTYGNYSYFYNYHHKDVTNFSSIRRRVYVLPVIRGTYSGNLSTTFPRTSQKRIPSLGKQYPKRRTRISIRSFEISPAYRERKALRIYGFRLCTRRMEPDGSVECDGSGRFVVHQEFGATFTPKVSAMYKLGDFNIRATYSNGFKAPTLKELHDDYITQIGGGPWKHYYGNKDLKPQKSNYYSASVEYQRRTCRSR